MVATLPGLRVGLNCTVELDAPDGEGTELKSRIEDLRGDQLIISWPTRRGQNIPISIGSMLFLTVPVQSAGTLYLDCELVARSSGAEGGLPLLTVRVVAVGQQQQRQHYRLYLSLQPVDCLVWRREFGESEAEGYWQPVGALITDMSGGGLGMTCDAQVPEGARMRVTFPYPMGSGTMVAELRVAKSLASTVGGRARYKVGTQFESLDRLARERFLRCIHRYQVEQRRRENARVGPGH